MTLFQILLYLIALVAWFMFGYRLGKSRAYREVLKDLEKLGEDFKRIRDTK